MFGKEEKEKHGDFHILSPACFELPESTERCRAFQCSQYFFLPEGKCYMENGNLETNQISALPTLAHFYSESLSPPPSLNVKGTIIITTLDIIEYSLCAKHCAE